MGQKANILTLRKNKQLSNTYSSNMYENFNSSLFHETLKRAFDKKGIIVTAQKVSKNGNTNFISLDTLYKTAQILKYNKKVKHKLSPAIKKTLQKAGRKRRYKMVAKKTVNTYKTLLKKTEKKHTYRGFLTILNKGLKSKLVALKFTLLNRKVNKFIMYNFWKTIKKFKRPLFTRRFNLFYDFVKLASLFVHKQINIQAFCNILGTVFKFLTKKSHSKFFFFVRAIFHFFLKAAGTKIKGIKMVINGRLKGKLRAKPMKLTVGKLKSQSIAAKNDLSKRHIHTLYGSFGMSIWINYKRSKKAKINVKKETLKKNLLLVKPKKEFSEKKVLILKSSSTNNTILFNSKKKFIASKEFKKIKINKKREPKLILTEKQPFGSSSNELDLVIPTLDFTKNFVKKIIHNNFSKSPYFNIFAYKNNELTTNFEMQEKLYNELSKSLRISTEYLRTFNFRDFNNMVAKEVQIFWNSKKNDTILPELSKQRKTEQLKFSALFNMKTWILHAPVDVPNSKFQKLNTKTESKKGLLNNIPTRPNVAIVKPKTTKVINVKTGKSSSKSTKSKKK